MRVKDLDGQLQLDIFEPAPRGTPTWDDVHKGRAHLVDRIEPCEHDDCMYWQGGQCVHTAENYGFPKKRPNGMCLKHFIVWSD